MKFEEMIGRGHAAGASDLHLVSGGRAIMRLHGVLHALPEELSRQDVAAIAEGLLDELQLSELAARRSVDLALTVGGVRCRMSVFHAENGLNLAVRLLPQVVPNLLDLNLHPALAELCRLKNGLVLVSGPTGSGKSSTLAALVTTINRAEARHIITIESPIEFMLKAEKSFVQQREVGRDTPSFEQGILDALRQDPDVLVVGEMREPQVMRLVLGAAETGHVVMTTVHSSNAAEALQRVVAAFPAEIQNNVAAQLADAVQVVIAQRLHWHAKAGIRIPECEILKTNHAVRNHIRSRAFFKLGSDIEIGAEEGMFTFERYGRWVAGQRQWQGETVPAAGSAPAAEEDGRIEIAPFAGPLDHILKRGRCRGLLALPSP